MPDFLFGLLWRCFQTNTDVVIDGQDSAAETMETVVVDTTQNPLTVPFSEYSVTDSLLLLILIFLFLSALWHLVKGVLPW